MTTCWIGLALLAALAPTPAPPTQAAAGASARPAARASHVSVQSRAGEWTRRAAEGLSLSSLGDLEAIALRFESASAPARAAADAFEIRLGPDEWLVARVARASGEQLWVEFDAGVELELAIDDILSIVAPARLSAAIEPAPSGDRLYWLRPQGVDRVDGSFQRFAADGVVFESSLGTRAFPWNEVGALFIEPLGARTSAPRSARSVCLDLAPSGRLRGELVGVQVPLVRMRWRGARELTLDVGAVEQLVLDDGSVEHLGALTPARVVEGWPGDDAGMSWPYKVDHSVMGAALRAGGRVWPRGIGVHAPSRLEWTLDGGWTALFGAVAIDDSVELLAYRGSVRCAIYLDDAQTPVWRSGRIEGASPPVAIAAVQLAGVRRIALEVEMDERLHVADRLNWLDLRLVR